MSNFTLPTERIELPSKGILYSKDSVLKQGYIELKYLSAKDEDILTNRNYWVQDIVVDKLFESMIATPGVNIKELFAGDVDAIFYACRILAYGAEYKFKATHPITSSEVTATVDLNEMDHLPLDPIFEKATENEFEFNLPQSKIPVTFKLLTRADRDNIKEEEKKWAKLFPDKSYGRALFLIYSLTSVNGQRTPQAIREFVDKGIMTAMDASKLRQYISKLSPGLNTKVQIDYGDNVILEGDVPITGTFLWPDSLE